MIELNGLQLFGRDGRKAIGRKQSISHWCCPFLSVGRDDVSILFLDSDFATRTPLVSESFPLIRRR